MKRLVGYNNQRVSSNDSNAENNALSNNQGGAPIASAYTAQ